MASRIVAWTAAAIAIPLLITACSDQRVEAVGDTDESRFVPNTRLNKLSITADDQIMWNGRVVNERQLATLLEQVTKLDPEPELRFQPKAGASYEKSARVLEIVKDSKAANFGFVGNEFYSTEAPPD